MADLDPRDAELPRIKAIIEQVKTFDRAHHKKRTREPERRHSDKDSEEIESEEYRDGCPDYPLLELNLKRGSFYSFRLEKEEERPEAEGREGREGEGRAMAMAHPQIIRSISLQSLESLEPRLEASTSRCYDLFSTEGSL
jgi:hypothetical protein